MPTHSMPRPQRQVLQVGLLLRNPLLELRVWILDLVFGNLGGPFWPILADWGASGPQKSIPDDLTDLGTQNESSGACLRPDFGHFRQKCERFSRISNFNIKKSPLQSLNFLSRSFLSGSSGVRKPVAWAVGPTSRRARSPGSRVGREHCSHVHEHLFTFTVRKFCSEMNTL